MCCHQKTIVLLLFSLARKRPHPTETSGTESGRKRRRPRFGGTLDRDRVRSERLEQAKMFSELSLSGVQPSNLILAQYLSPGQKSFMEQIGDSGIESY